MTKQREQKGFLDSLFDVAENVVDGASKALSGIPEPDNDDEDDGDTGFTRPDRGNTPKKTIDVASEQQPLSIDVASEQQPLLKSGGQKKGPRQVELHIRALSKRERGGGVAILAETPTHEVVCIMLSAEDWKILCDNADWMRMVKE